MSVGVYLYVCVCFVGLCREWGQVVQRYKNMDPEGMGWIGFGLLFFPSGRQATDGMDDNGYVVTRRVLLLLLGWSLDLSSKVLIPFCPCFPFNQIQYNNNPCLVVVSYCGCFVLDVITE